MVNNNRELKNLSNHRINNSAKPKPDTTLPHISISFN